MSMLTRKKVLLAKLETTYGSDPTPTAASNAILAIEPDIKENFSPFDRGIHLSTLSNKPSLSQTQYSDITFRCELKGSGTPGTPPRMGALLQACSMSETIVSGTSVTYAPTSSNQQSVYLYLYADGRLHKVAGCVGSWKLTCPPGGIAVFDFNFSGKYVAATSAAIVTGTYDQDPPQCKSCSVTYNSYTDFIPRQIELDLANTLAQRPNLNSSTGLEGFFVTSRKPTMVIDVESTIVASYNFRSDAMTNQREVAWQVGSVAGNICSITVPKYNITTVEYQDGDGILLDKVTGECTVNSADDEIELVFT